jgi:flagellar biosynthesis protein FlhG
MTSRKPCYTIHEVADLSGLEESLVQYYERIFADLLPARVYHAGQSLFQPESVEVFRRIRQHTADRPGDISREDLRRLIFEQPIKTEPALRPTLAKILGVTSGKGGVGKSSLSLNLAIELQRRGYRTALFDADLGTANLHILAGVTPERTLYDLTHGTASLEECLVEGPEGLGLIAGGSGVCQLANLPRYRRFSLISELEKLERCVDLIIMDTAPGISGTVTDFLLVSDLSLVLTTPDLTSVTDAYSLVKALLGQSAEQQIELVPNRVRGIRQAEEVYHRLAGCIGRFLEYRIPMAGYLVKDAAVERAAERRAPFLLAEPHTRISRCVRLMADRLEESFLIEDKERSTFSRLWECWAQAAQEGCSNETAGRRLVSTVSV